MKIIVIGAGASGVAAAINLKRKNPQDDILIIEHLDKPLKKILATGNGKCNLGNDNIDFSLFKNSNFAKKIINSYDYKNFFESISIKTKSIDGLAYPVSESAVSIRDALLKECRKLKIKINVEEKLIDYKISEPIIVITNKKTYNADKLILAGGLKSSPKLGSDGSVIEILKGHNYKISPLNPGLSPLFTIEKTKEIDGVRCKSNVKLIANNKIIYEELGEVLFKERGLSGIVIFNMVSRIAHEQLTTCKIAIDLLPDYTQKEIDEYYHNHSLDELLLAFINPKVSLYLKTRFSDEKTLINSLKNLEFTFDKSYGFEFSQVTVGGVDPKELNEHLESNIEKNVYIIGELVDVDGPCGGYNLTWAFASALNI